MAWEMYRLTLGTSTTNRACTIRNDHDDPRLHDSERPRGSAAARSGTATRRVKKRRQPSRFDVPREEAEATFEVPREEAEATFEVR